MSNYINVDYMQKKYNAFSYSGDLNEFSCKQMHYHDYHEIVIIKNGISILVDEQFSQMLFGSRAAFIPASIEHRVQEVGRDFVEFQSIFLRKDLFDPDIEIIKIFELSELSRSLINELCARKDINITDGIPGDCLQLLLKVISNDFTKNNYIIKLPESRNENINKIIKYIQKNYPKKLNIDDFKNEVPYSSRHIGRIFSEELGISIFEYLRLFRILMSAIELSKTKNKVIEIAFNCGYESLSSFYKDFKKYYVISPAEFRKIIKQDQYS